MARRVFSAGALLVALTLLLGACGGGGGEREENLSTLPTFTPTPERTPKPRPSPVEATVSSSGTPLQTQARVATVSGAERVTFAFDGGLPGYRVEYVDKLARCGSGESVQLRGNAFMLVTFKPAAAHDQAGKSTLPATKVRGFGSVITEMELLCDLEGVVQWGIGVVDNQPFTVSTAENPSALVIDVSTRR